MKNNDDFDFKDKNNGNHDYENDFNFVNNDNKVIEEQNNYLNKENQSKALRNR